MASIDIEPIFKRSFSIFQDNVGLLLGLSIGGIVIGQIVGGIGAGAQLFINIAAEQLDSDIQLIVIGIGALIRMFFSLLAFIFNSYFGMSLIKISLRLVRGDTATFKDAIIDFPMFIQGVLANFLVGLVCGLGVLFCIVPGVILSLGLYMVLYLVVDKNMNAIDAIKGSWHMTDGSKLNLFLWLICCMVLSFVGLLACGVGVFVAMPVILLGNAIIYTSLSGGDQGNPLSLEK
jgi:uncharacterized membrane protein